MDQDQRREFSEQMNRSHGSFELVLSPFLLGLLGFWIDGRLGITPVLTIALSVLGVVGAVIKLYFGYVDSMTTLNAERAARTPRGRGAVPTDVDVPSTEQAA